MTINYIEKGYGLHKKIVESGNVLWQENGIWKSTDDISVQTIIDNYTLDDCKADICNKVAELATTKFDKAIANYSRGELAGWPILRAEAHAYNSDPTSPVPSITLEAGIRGVTVDALVQKVLNNANTYDQLRANIAGMSGKHRDAISALTTFSDVTNYDYSTGWPGV